MKTLKDFYYRESTYADGSDRAVGVEEVPETLRDEVDSLRIVVDERVGRGYMIPDGRYIEDDHTGLHVVEYVTLD